MALIHRIDHPVVDGIRLGRVDRRGNYHLTASCIVYRIGDTVIDTGPAREISALRGYFADKPVTQVLLTHHHEDHSGNGAYFQQQQGAAIYSHPHNHPALSRGIRLPMIRRMTFGDVPAYQPQVVPEHIELSSGHHLQAIHTPGHTPDLVCYLEPNEGWLFSGDLYVSSRLKYMTVDEDMGDWIASLERVLSLDFDTLFCSHRAVVYNGKEELAKKLDFFKSFREEVGHLHQQGLSEKQITRKLLGREDSNSYLSRMHMSKRNMVTASLQSLSKLSTTTRC
ncbi:MBL fold metallo-hydrolase [Spongiibacter sp.]|uniref:MBL fold metallo-hydrolase n=1 Tax=Spongiibacter sp. TaxID=2024860 RepID=UPI0035678A86